MKKILAIASFSAALALGAGGPLIALEEQKIQVAPDSPAAAAAQPAPAAKADKGTEVRIPGIGTIGKLPKIDFGLELLYGAAEPDRPDQAREPSKIDDTTSGATIRGEIKHKF